MSLGPHRQHVLCRFHIPGAPISQLQFPYCRQGFCTEGFVATEVSLVGRCMVHIKVGGSACLSCMSACHAYQRCADMLSLRS